MQTILDMEPIENPTPKRPRGRAWRIVAVVLALHAVALGGFVVFQGCHRSEPAARSEDGASTTAAPDGAAPATDPALAGAPQAAGVAQPGTTALTPEERMPGDAQPPPSAPAAPAEVAPPPPAPPSMPAMPAEAKPSKPAGAVTHVVKSGETPASIAKRYGVSADALMKANGITDASKLKVGQKLAVPSAKLKASAPLPRPGAAPKAAPAKTASAATHLVKAGETITSIAKKHGVSADALMRANGITDASKLKVGQKLKIPAGRAAPSAPADPRRAPRRLAA